jgi:hypothetical protein
MTSGRINQGATIMVNTIRLDNGTLRVEMEHEGLLPVGEYWEKGDYIYSGTLVEGHAATVGYNHKKHCFSLYMHGCVGVDHAAELYRAIRLGVAKLGIHAEQQAAAAKLIEHFTQWRDETETYKWIAQIPLTPGLYLRVNMGYVERIQSGDDPNTSISIVLVATAGNQQFCELHSREFARSRYPADGSRTVTLGAWETSPKFPHQKWAALQKAIDRIKAGDLSGFYQLGYSNRSFSIKASTGERIVRDFPVWTSLDPEGTELRQIFREQLDSY